MFYYINPKSADDSEHRILVIAHAPPWPPTSGGQIDIYGRIVAIKKLGINVDLIITVFDNNLIESLFLINNLNIDSCFIIPRNKDFFSFVNPFLPYHISSRKSIEWRNVLNFISKNKYNAVLSEGSYVLPMSFLFSNFFNKPLLHRVHNIESIYFYNLYLSETFSFKKYFYLYESFRWKIIEKYIFKDIINLCISTDEFNFLETFYPGKNFWLPPALKNFPPCEPIRRPGRAKKFLITASLSIPDNWHGIKWFLSRVWLNLLQKFPDISLTIVGRKPNNSCIQYLQKFPNVSVFFNVPNIDLYFLDADIYISPIFFGAGVKIKTVEALSFGLPVIATPVSAKGCNFKHNSHLLIAETEKDFIYFSTKLIEDFNLRNYLAINARNYICNKFNQKDNLLNILSELKILNKS